MEKEPISKENSIVTQEFHDRTSRIAELAMSWPITDHLPKEPVEVDTLSASSFDELYSHKKAIQRYFVKLGRPGNAAESKYHKVFLQRKSDPNFDMRSHVQEEIMNHKNIALVVNKFPYDLPPDTTHLNLWIADKVKDHFTEMLSFLNDQLESLNLSNEDIIVYKNPEFSRSIPEVDHYHIFANIPPEEAAPLLSQ